jgi:hypothetical protein
MAEQEHVTLMCDYCREPVNAADEYCPNCGSIFEEDVVCNRHSERQAQGVCIICSLACCEECGCRVNDLFLCEQHSQYEIYEGMARVAGGNDFALTQHACNCLEQAGLHPFLFSRKETAFSGGGPEWSLFRAFGEYDGHIVNEFKIMVPCQEVIAAEQELEELELAK